MKQLRLVHNLTVTTLVACSLSNSVTSDILIPWVSNKGHCRFLLTRTIRSYTYSNDGSFFGAESLYGLNIFLWRDFFISRGSFKGLVVLREVTIFLRFCSSISCNRVAEVKLCFLEYRSSRTAYKCRDINQRPYEPLYYFALITNSASSEIISLPCTLSRLPRPFSIFSLSPPRPSLIFLGFRRSCAQQWVEQVPVFLYPRQREPEKALLWPFLRFSLPWIGRIHRNTHARVSPG